MQISADEYREIRKHHDQQKSRYEQGETSKDGATKSWVTSRILLNKWQRQKKGLSALVRRARIPASTGKREVWKKAS